MKLSPFVRQFLVNYLPHIKGASPYTVKTYRDAFKLFLPFAAQYHGIKVTSLRVEHISSELILAFLNALEKERKKPGKHSRSSPGGPEILCQDATLSLSTE